MNIERIKRHGSYLFWVFGEQVANVGLPRLLLIPLAAYIVGRDEIGVFLTALSVTSILGVQPANGLATALLRHLNEYEFEDQQRYYSTAGVMCLWAMSAIVVVGVFAALALVGVGVVPWKIVSYLVPLAISLHPENQFMLVLTELRVSRKFKERTLWYFGKMCLVFAFSIAGILLYGTVGLAWGYMLGNLVSYVILRVRRRAWLNKGYCGVMAKSIRHVWFHVTVAGIIALAGPYLNRIILSFYHEYGDVADLFAANSILFSFMVLISCPGYVLMSVLARYGSPEELSSSAKVQFSVLLGTGIVLLPVAFKFLGPVVFGILFPKFSENSLGLLDILIWAIPFVTLTYLTRPFVIKFAPIQVTPVVNTVSLAAMLLPALLLIPAHGIVGAAWAIVVGQVVTGVSWACAALFFTHRPRAAIA